MVRKYQERDWLGRFKAAPIIDKNCPQCGVLFSVRLIKQPRIFCSRSCYSKSTIGIKRVFNEQWIDNLRKSHIGIKQSESAKEKLSKYWQGRIFSQEIREKISAGLKRHFVNNGSHWVGRRQSKEHVLKRSGVNSNFWQGGVYSIHQKARRIAEYKSWHRSILQRDNYTCRYCGVRGGQLNAHHIKSFSSIIKTIKLGDNLYEKLLNCKALWDINNGETLCVSCHRDTDNFGNLAVTR